MSSFLKTFDEILNAILTDYQNQLPDVDRSPGTLCFVKSACLASALWGIYKYQDYIARQMFPDTADTSTLERHAARRGLTRLANETDAALLARLLSVLQQPPAGGNQADWELWAKEASAGSGSNVERAKTVVCYPHARGIGSINIAVTSTRTEVGHEEEPTIDLIEAIVNYVETKRPITAYDYEIHAAFRQTENVTMTVSGLTAAQRTAVAADITAFMKTIAIGKPLYRAQLISIAIERGAENVTLTAPVADVTVDAGPTNYERIWPGTITVSAA